MSVLSAFVFVTRLSVFFFLFASCGLVVSVLIFNFVLMFFHTSPKKAKPQKHKNTKTAEKKRQHIFSASAVVFTNGVPNFLGWAKMQVFAENTITIVVSA